MSEKKKCEWPGCRRLAILNLDGCKNHIKQIEKMIEEEENEEETRRQETRLNKGDKYGISFQNS